MTTTNTMFLNFMIDGYPENTPDPFFARLNQSMSVQTRYNVQARRQMTLSMASGDTVTVTPSNLALADWRVLYARVIGTARIQTVGKDTDGTTTINGYTPAYGTSIYPGYIVLSTYNLSAITITAQADSTVVEFLNVLSAEDT
jgi:hypothetical protein